MKLLRCVIICVIVGIGTCQKPRFAIKRTSSNLFNAEIQPYYQPHISEKSHIRRSRQPDVPQYLFNMGVGFNPLNYDTKFQRERGGPSAGRTAVPRVVQFPHAQEHPHMFIDPEYRTTNTPSCAETNSQPMPCERDGEYNEDIVKKMETVLKTTKLNAITDNDVVIHLINETDLANQEGKDIFIPPSLLSARFGGNFVEESPACRAQESIIYPQRAKTRANDWVFVVNQNIMRQGVRVEKCLSESTSCSLGNDLPPTLKTTCRQKFIYRKLLVLTKEGTDILPESVLMPSCCVCYISRTSQLLEPRKKPTNSTQEAETATEPTPTPETTESGGKTINFK